MFKRASFSTWVLTVFVAMAFGFGVWGWNAQATALNLQVGDVVYRSFTSLMLSDIYNDSQVWNNDWRLQVSRFSGMTAFILVAIKAVLVVLSDRFLVFKARFLKDHVFVIGDDVFAGAVVDAVNAQKKPVIWLGAPETVKINSNEYLVETGVWHDAALSKYGVKNAASVIVAYKDDALSIASARRVRALISETQNITITAKVEAPWLAERIDEIVGLAGVRLFSQARAAARILHRKHPPFLIAQAQKQQRIHAVIFGFGKYGEAVMVDILLSSLTSYLDKPLITIVDPRVETIKSGLQLRYPELEKSVEINFVAKTFEGKDQPLTQSEVLKLGKKASVSLVYICVPEGAKALKMALAMQTLAQVHGWTKGPVCVRLADGNTLSRVPAGVTDLAAGQVVSFGGLVDLVCGSGVLDDSVDTLAKSMHAAYRAVATGDSPSNVDWDDLGEDMRNANRRLVVHIAAKLSSAELDIENWIKSIDVDNNNAEFPAFGAIEDKPSMVNVLARLEHERWMADRRLSGWRYGTVRNNPKRIHPDLIPYDALSEQSQSYDIKMIEELFEAFG